MSDGDNKKPRPEWITPRAKDAGTIADILKGGGGKLSVETTDTGDIRKPKGSG
jgi:hypothetical protein